MTVRDTGGNVAVDFVWGNLPLQPDDDRGSDVLDPALDNHNIAANGWSGYPSFLPNDTNDVADALVPTLAGLDSADAVTTIEFVNLVAGTPTEVTAGATLANDGLVKTQSPVAGTKVDEGTTVDFALYNYVATVPNIVGKLPAAAETDLAAVGLVLGTPTTSAAGATAENDGTIKSQTPAAAASADISDNNVVEVVLFAYAG